MMISSKKFRTFWLRYDSIAEKECFEGLLHAGRMGVIGGEAGIACLGGV
jgi:hypothetical protein